MIHQELTSEEEAIGKAIVNAAFKVHSALGPGLLERIYEICMVHELRKAGYFAARNFPIPIHYDEIKIEAGLRIDLIVQNMVIAEIKAVDQVNPYYFAQVLSQLKLTKHRLGFLINFNVPKIKDGIKRFVL